MQFLFLHLRPAVLVMVYPEGKLTQYLDNLEVSGFLEVHEPLGVHGERYWRYRPCDMVTLFHLQWLSGRSRMRSWHAIATANNISPSANMPSRALWVCNCAKQVLDAHFKGRRSIIVCLLAPEGVLGNEHSAAADVILGANSLFRDGES